MKPNAPVTAVFIAAALLVACSDNHKPAPKKQAQAIVAKPAVTAGQVESRYRKLAGLQGKLWRQLARVFFDDVQKTISNYQHGDDEATADTATVFIPDPDIFTDSRPVIFRTRDTLHYTPALTEKGIIARIDSRPVAEKAAEAAENRGLLQTLSAATEIQTDILPEGNVASVWQIAPFRIEDDDGVTDFQGATITTAYNEKTVLENLGAGELSFHLQPLHLSDAQGSISIDPLQGHYVLTGQGKLNLAIDPVQFAIKTQNKSYQWQIQNIAVQGENVLFDALSGLHLGQLHGKAEPVVFSTDTAEKAVAGLSYDRNIAKNLQGNYDFTDNFRITLKVENQENYQLAVNNEIKAVSPELLQSLSDTQQFISTDRSGKMPEKLLNTLFNNLVLNHTSWHTDAVFHSDKGSAQLSVRFAVRPDSKISESNGFWAQVAAGIRDKQYFYLKELLKTYADMSIDVSVDKSLLDELEGININDLPLRYITTFADGKYRFRLESHQGELRLNGYPVPF